MSFLKASINGLLRHVGCELHRLPCRYACHIHPFPDQRVILSRRPVDLILDVGGNVGQSVARYRWLFPTATIHSFEPVPEAFRQLQQAASGDPHIHPWQAAVSDVLGTVTFHSNQMSDTSSLLATRTELKGDVHLGTKDVLEVPSTTLDHFCAEQKINQISILKMDVQGGEARVLAGAQGLLERQAADLIFTEVWFDAPYDGAPLFCDLHLTLSEFDYQFYGIYFGPHQYGNRPVFMADAIYLNRRTQAELDPANGGIRWDYAQAFVDKFGE